MNITNTDQFGTLVFIKFNKVWGMLEEIGINFATVCYFIWDYIVIKHFNSRGIAIFG